MFFFLLQTEQGDIFKCTLETDEEMVTVTEIRLKYFDTTPIASSMCVLKTGFLFVASEFGNQYVLLALNFSNHIICVQRKSADIQLGHHYFTFSLAISIKLLTWVMMMMNQSLLVVWNLKKAQLSSSNHEL